MEWSYTHGPITSPPSYKRSFAKLGLGPQSAKRYERKKGVDVKALLERDEQIAYEYQMYERASNILFYRFITQPELSNLERLWETNSDHGFPHARRMEKYLKAVHGAEPALRSNGAYHPFTFSQYVSIRFHDLFELEAGKKKHAEGAALTVLGTLLDPEVYLDAQTDPRYDFPSDYRVSSEEWQKQIWGSAIMILHHSYPEGLRSVAGRLEFENGVITEESFRSLIDCQKILTGLEQLASEKGKPIEDLFTPFSLDPIQSFIQAIRDKKPMEIPKFSKEDVEGLLKATDVFAAVDKLDSILPAGLSTARTFQTSSERALYVPIQECLKFARVKDPQLNRAREVVCKKLGIGYREFDQKLAAIESGTCDLRFEYELRLVFANSHSSPDDFSRFLFEAQREEFVHLGGWISSMFRHGLLQKKIFLGRLLDAIAYDTETHFIGHEYSEMEDQRSRDPETIQRLEIEKQTVLEIVREKMKRFAMYTTNDSQLIDHMKALLALTPNPSSGNPFQPFELPYSFYFPTYANK